MQTVAALYGYCGCEEPPHTWGADYMIHHPHDLNQILFTN